MQLNLEKRATIEEENVIITYRNRQNLIHLIFLSTHDLWLFLDNLVYLEQDDVIHINQVFDL
jgi:hypothetical protein